MPTSKNMAMQVGDGFATIRAVINDEPVTGSLDPHQLSDMRGFGKQMAQQSRILGARFRNTRNHPLGDDQHMHGRLGIYIVKSQHLIVFVNDMRRNFTCDDLFENRLAHGNSMHHEGATGTGTGKLHALPEKFHDLAFELFAFG